MSFVQFLLGLRGPRSSVTEAERTLLCGMASKCRRVVEVGVYEGATSRCLADCLGDAGELFLVDPFVPVLRAERLLGVSFPQRIARHAVGNERAGVRWIRSASVQAAKSGAIAAPLDLVFIDADHSYEAVLADFHAWTPLVGPSGVVGLHDSRLCEARPDLPANAGPVRLVRDIGEGRFPAWAVVAEADSLTIVGRAEERDSRRSEAG